MPFCLQGYKRGRNAYVYLADNPFVILTDGSNGCDNGATERVFVIKSFRRKPVVLFGMAAVKNERIVDPFRPEKEGNFIRPYV